MGKKKVRKTVKGPVTKISPIRNFRTGEITTKSDPFGVININIELPSKRGRKFAEVAFYKQPGLWAFFGVRPNSRGNWVRFREEIQYGTVVEANGPYEIHEWSGHTVKKEKKPRVTVYGAEQVKIEPVPCLPDRLPD